MADITQADIEKLAPKADVILFCGLSGAAVDNLLVVLLLSTVTGMAMADGEPTPALAAQMLLKTMALAVVGPTPRNCIKR